MEESKKTVGLNYTQAIDALQNGYRIRVPEWTGYWFQSNEGIKVFTRTGDVLDTSMHEEFKNRTDWQIVTEGLGFDFAILALKSGKLLQRAGWNGKGMYIFIRPTDNLAVDFIPKVKSLPESVKSHLVEAYSSKDYVPFTAYLCMKSADGTIVNGWLASQTDMLATDWQIFQ